MRPYTVYLDFGGFAFSGSWAKPPENRPARHPAYTVDGDASTFNSTELDNIKIMWSRVAEKYSGFNINVTTVDPAVAAGQAGSDAQRQPFYDNTPKLMHTIIGGNGSWYGSGGGTSYVGKTAFAQTGSNGYHTNFVFAAQHQPICERSRKLQPTKTGTASISIIRAIKAHSTNTTTGTGTGPGSKAPIMGKSYNSERGLWRIGYTSAGGTQNDLDYDHE